VQTIELAEGAITEVAKGAIIERLSLRSNPREPSLNIASGIVLCYFIQCGGMAAAVSCEKLKCSNSIY